MKKFNLKHIFEVTATDTTKKYLIRGSYLEIYNENVRDLLGKDYKTTLELHVRYTINLSNGLISFLNILIYRKALIKVFMYQAYHFMNANM